MYTFARAALVGTVAVAAMAGSATAQTRSSFTVTELKSVLSQAGLSPKIVKDQTLKDKARAPRAIQGTVKSDKGTFTFFVRGKGCKGAPPACEIYIFFANWNLDRDATPADLRIANKFNDTKHYGRAYVLQAKRQVGVDYVVELRGGVTRDYMIARAKRWPAVISAYVAHIRKATSKK